MIPDNGLQAERTVMAWQRTALGLAGVSALLLHHAGGRLGESLAGAAGLIVALGTLVLVEVRHARLRDDQCAPMGVRAVRGLAAVTVLLAVAAVIMVLTPPG